MNNYIDYMTLEISQCSEDSRTKTIEWVWVFSGPESTEGVTFELRHK